MVRAWSAIERLIDWRIHQVAYVLNYNPRGRVKFGYRSQQADIAFLD